MIAIQSSQVISNRLIWFGVPAERAVVAEVEQRGASLCRLHAFASPDDQPYVSACQRCIGLVARRYTH
jgi:hypothetical protein